MYTWSNFVNLWTKSDQSSNCESRAIPQIDSFNVLEGFFQASLGFEKYNLLSSKTVHTLQLFTSVKLKMAPSLLIVRMLLASSLQILMLFFGSKKVLRSTDHVSSKSIQNRLCAYAVKRHEQTRAGNRLRFWNRLSPAFNNRLKSAEVIRPIKAETPPPWWPKLANN